MSKGRALGVVLVSMAWIGAIALAGPHAQAADTRPTILSLKLSGVVDPFMASYVERGISKAIGDHDAAVLITIDTPGGLDSSMRHIIKAILASQIPVICYTAPSGARAASAGTFIMLACPINAMAPGTNIGAAHPVGVTGVIETEKVTNDAAAFIRSLADRWNRNADWAEKAVRDAISAPAEQAVQLHVVDALSASDRGLLGNVGGCPDGIGRATFSTGLLRTGTRLSAVCSAKLAPFGMSIAENLFHSFADPNIAFLLLNIGFIALIVWLIHPAFHFALGVGIVTIALALAILETLPVRLTGVLLLLVAAVLFVFDVKAKAHGILTAAGIAVLILGGLLLFNPTVPSAHVSRPLIVLVALAAGAFTFFALGALASARHQPVKTGLEVLKGSAGVTISALEPQGTVRARGETWTAESTTGPIPPGTPVRVVDVKGVKLLVEPDVTPVGTAHGNESEGRVP